MTHSVIIKNIKDLTHDVKEFTVSKPQGYRFLPGQATEISINKEELKKEKRPFTFTNLNKDKSLEFVIKRYDDHDGITKKLHTLKRGDELLIEDPFGSIKYSSEGVFLAGGAGITPFIAILRQLSKEGKIGSNKLIFSNKTAKDMILEAEFKNMYKKYPHNLILTTTQEVHENYENGRIDKMLLNKHLSNFKVPFYICGPREMVKALSEIVVDLGASTDSIVFEK